MMIQEAIDTLFSYRCFNSVKKHLLRIHHVPGMETGVSILCEDPHMI